MPTTFALRLATYLLVYDGLVALYLGGLIGPVGVGLVTVAVTASWWRDRLLARLPRLREGSAGLIVVVAALSALDLLYFAGSTLIAMVRFLLFLVVYSLFMRRAVAHSRDVGLLAFVMLAAAAPATSSVGFLFAFLVFLIVGTWMLMLHHVVSESERSAGVVAGGAWRIGVGRDLLRLSVAGSVLTLAITAAFFFVIPRVGRTGLALGAQVGRMVSGFSERVELGAFGEIETDAAVVMRVQISEGPPEPERLSDLRWRGIAFDHFDGRAWTVGPARRAAVKRSPSGQFEISSFRGPGALLVQDVSLEPLASEVIFGASRLLRVAVGADALTVDDMRTVSVPASASARLHYVAHSQLEPAGAPNRDTDELLEARDPAALSRYLQLPPLPARIGELARDTIAGARDPVEAARRLTEFLSRFRYTTTLQRGAALDPLEEFLFVRRSGNCEYFAAALAVMLRSVGIPARMVNGFMRGEWNPHGRYFMVRLRDAHSWVEAYIPGQGWATLDPSPRGPAGDRGAERASLSLYLDALRARWSRYVVHWGLQDQLAVALGIHRATSSVRAGRVAVPGGEAAGRLVLAGVVLVAAGVTLAYARRGKRRAALPAASGVPGFYARALRALAKRGLRPEPGETAREFCLRVARALPECAGGLARLTAAYERARFGSAPLAVAELAELDRAIRALGRPAG